MLNTREKQWLIKLKRHNSSSVVVMHPMHAEVIARKLELQKENIIGAVAHHPKRYDAQRLARIISEKRLKRRLEKRQEKRNKKRTKIK